MPHCELRVFFRDQHLDLTDLYLNNGYRSIPVLVFFDQDWNEVARWIERPHAATQRSFAIRSKTTDIAPQDKQGSRADGVPRAGPGRVRRASREESLAGYRQGDPDDPRAPARPRSQGVATPGGARREAIRSPGRVPRAASRRRRSGRSRAALRHLVTESSSGFRKPVLHAGRPRRDGPGPGHIARTGRPRATLDERRQR